MRRGIPLLMALIPVFFLGGCGDDRMTAPERTPVDSPELIAHAVIDAAGWTLDPQEAVFDPETASPALLGFEREPVVDDIFHYSFDLRVGPGPFDVIGIHRVVREKLPFVPVRTSRAIFLTHGDVADFEHNFLAIPGEPVERAMSVVLARADIDCWGLDLGWSRVPEATTDFPFFEGWGIGKELEHMDVAITVSRLVRKLTGSGHSKLHIFGYSGGGQDAFAYVNEDSQRPPGKRNIKGLIPFEADPVYSADPEHQARTCLLTADYQALLDAGMYQDEFGLVFSLAAQLAQTDPDGESPVLGPPFTNLQAALFLAAATWNLLDYTPFLHFAGGEFEEGLPVDLRYSRLDTYLEFTKGLNPYFPTEIFRDRYALQCGEPDLPWNDHLGDIDVPILFLGADGGIGEFGLDAVNATSSTDVTVLIIDRDADRSLDFGHIDMMTATDAVEAVWIPMRDWILAH